MQQHFSPICCVQGVSWFVAYYLISLQFVSYRFSLLSIVSKHQWVLFFQVFAKDAHPTQGFIEAVFRLACYRRDGAVFQRLLDKGVNIDASDKNAWTAHMIAVKNRDEELSFQTADVNATNTNGDRALT
eukprot:m.56373 g.56373  ORF g.56373 m.56373 type:complete len:129 (+) comp11190_c0_seq4:103-489(+)